MKSLAPQMTHPLLVEGSFDDRARQALALTLRHHITSRWMPATRRLFDAQAAPAWAARHGRPPQSPGEVREAMDATSWYRFYLSARRSAQELIWNSIRPGIEADGGRREAPANARGSLTLEPGFQPPAYLARIDIHCMPGGYCHDRGEGDVAAGQLYDRGVYLYMMGLMGPANDAVGRLAAGWLKARDPGFAPRRILDLGCGVGHGTLPLAEAWPGAEVHGLDAGAALLRHAHGRAEALGHAVHFRQGDAEATPWPDGHFDLVASTIVLHETSRAALPRMLAECRRLLAPDGWMLHVDQPRFDDDAWATFLQENETHYNNEPFWRTYRRLDLAALAREAGFAADRVEEDVVEAAVVRQAQNNAPGEQSRKGFGVLAARA